MRLMLAALVLLAQDAPKKRELKDRVEIAGTVVCIGCTLEKGHGADAQCTLHAKHGQGLLAADGSLRTFIDNTRGHGLITESKLRGKELKVLGWAYGNTGYVEVWKYQVKDGDKWVAWDWCRTCGWEKGDNKDTDLCDDCKK